MFIKYLQITILELDDTKRLICNNCIQQLETCLKFREQVETSLKALEVTVRLKSKFGYCFSF